jgi:hypothetical protein
VPILNELIGRAQASATQDTRPIMSEVVLEFIPVTEIVFDLGDTVRRLAPPKGKTAPASAEPDLYCWHVYGFERRLPKDWRFLNWARVATMVLAAALMVAVALLALSLIRV